jgi:hypothetical protein
MTANSESTIGSGELSSRVQYRVGTCAKQTALLALSSRGQITLLRVTMRDALGDDGQMYGGRRTGGHRVLGVLLSLQGALELSSTPLIR